MHKLVNISGGEFVSKVLNGEKDFSYVNLSDEKDFSKIEGYLEMNSFLKEEYDSKKGEIDVIDMSNSVFVNMNTKMEYEGEIRGVYLPFVKANNTDFSFSNLEASQFWDYCVLEKKNGEGLFFESVKDGYSPNFEQSIFKHVNFFEAFIPWGNFKKTDFRMGILKKIFMPYGIFDGANLENANCSYSNFSHSSFFKTDLKDANIVRGNFAFADFRGILNLEKSKGMQEASKLNGILLNEREIYVLEKMGFQVTQN